MSVVLAWVRVVGRDEDPYIFFCLQVDCKSVDDDLFSCIERPIDVVYLLASIIDYIKSEDLDCSVGGDVLEVGDFQDWTVLDGLVRHMSWMASVITVSQVVV